MNEPAELRLDTVPFWIDGKPLAASHRSGDVFNPATGRIARECTASREPDPGRHGRHQRADPHGVESVKFYTRAKVVTTRWPHQDTPAPGFHMPTPGVARRRFANGSRLLAGLPIACGAIAQEYPTKTV